MNQDLTAIRSNGNALDSLIALLRQHRGDLMLRPDDFLGWSKGARFYPLLYMLTRSAHSRDWETGDELSSHLLGRMSRLEVHHIFPKARLRKEGYKLGEVNALANFTFLTKDTNLRVADGDPAVYLEKYANKHPWNH